MTKQVERFHKTREPIKKSSYPFAAQSKFGGKFTIQLLLPCVFMLSIHSDLLAVDSKCARFIRLNQLSSMQDPVDRWLKHGVRVYGVTRNGTEDSLEQIIIPPYGRGQSIFMDVHKFTDSPTADGIKGIWKLWQSPELVLKIMRFVRDEISKASKEKKISWQNAAEEVRRRYEKKAQFGRVFTIQQMGNFQADGRPNFLNDEEWHQILRTGRPIRDRGGTSHTLVPHLDLSSAGINAHRNQWLIVIIAMDQYPNLFGAASHLPPVKLYQALGNEQWVKRWVLRKAPNPGETNNVSPWAYLFDTHPNADDQMRFGICRLEGKLREKSHFSAPEYFQLIFEKVTGAE